MRYPILRLGRFVIGRRTLFGRHFIWKTFNRTELGLQIGRNKLRVPRCGGPAWPYRSHSFRSRRSEVSSFRIELRNIFVWKQSMRVCRVSQVSEFRGFSAPDMMVSALKLSPFESSPTFRKVHVAIGHYWDVLESQQTSYRGCFDRTVYAKVAFRKGSGRTNAVQT